MKILRAYGYFSLMKTVPYGIIRQENLVAPPKLKMAMRYLSDKTVGEVERFVKRRFTEKDAYRDLKYALYSFVTDPWMFGGQISGISSPTKVRFEFLVEREKEEGQYTPKTDPFEADLELVSAKPNNFRFKFSNFSEPFDERQAKEFKKKLKKAQTSRWGSRTVSFQIG